MNHSYTGFVLLVIIVSVYVLFMSNYAYVSALKEKNVDGPLTDTKTRTKRDSLAAMLTNNSDAETVDISNVEEKLSKTEQESISKQITLNICCGANQRLNVTTMECIDSENTGPDKIEFVLDNFVVDERMGHGKIPFPQFQYGFHLLLGCPQENVVKFEWKNKTKSLYYIDQITGNLFELYSTTRKISSSFRSTFYCLDKSVDDDESYVALVCPCLEKICVPKCCQREFYFNTIENKCKKQSDDDIQKYYAQMYNKTEEVYGIPPYYLIHRTPKCTSQDKIIKSDFELQPLYIQQDGTLMVEEQNDNKYYLETDKYCIDMFSSGNESDTFVNGFACSINISGETQTPHGLNLGSTSNSSTDVNNNESERQNNSKYINEHKHVRKQDTEIKARHALDHNLGNVHLAKMLEMFCIIIASCIVKCRLFR